jgi:hypothetical protein
MKRNHMGHVLKAVVGALSGVLILGLTPATAHAATNPGIVASFENFYAPVDRNDCPNGNITLTRTDGSSFVEFDNFALSVSNSKKGVLGTSVEESFATEDGSKKKELQVQICGYDTNYLGATEVYTLQVKYVSADRKFAQELAIDFTLIPVDAKAKAARLLREKCPIDGISPSPYSINWNIEKAPKVKIGSTMTIEGTFYRFGYPADFEKVTLINSATRPEREVLLASTVTDKNGKFKLSFKTGKNRFYGYLLNFEERAKPVGPFFGTFDGTRYPIFINCDAYCSVGKMDPLYAPWEGAPAKSKDACAVAKHEYSLVAGNLSISIAGSNGNDRNRWLLALSVIKNSITDPSILTSKQTSAYTSNPAGISAGYNSTGTVWVSGHMRNGSYVRGYSRRKG